MKGNRVPRIMFNVVLTSAEVGGGSSWDWMVHFTIAMTHQDIKKLPSIKTILPPDLLLFAGSPFPCPPIAALPSTPCFRPLLGSAISRYDMLARTVPELSFGTVVFLGIQAHDAAAPDQAARILNREEKYECSRRSWLRICRVTARG